MARVGGREIGSGADAFEGFEIAESAAEDEVGEFDVLLGDGASVAELRVEEHASRVEDIEEETAVGCPGGLGALEGAFGAGQDFVLVEECLASGGIDACGQEMDFLLQVEGVIGGLVSGGFGGGAGAGLIGAITPGVAPGEGEPEHELGLSEVAVAGVMASLGAEDDLGEAIALDFAGDGFGLLDFAALEDEARFEAQGEIDEFAVVVDGTGEGWEFEGRPG
jgi:hypothetical protein